MKTAILSMVFSVTKFVRLRWMFLAAFVMALGLLVAAAIMDSVALAAVGAIAAFMAGEERASQILCNECAVDLQVDPEVSYPVA